METATATAVATTAHNYPQNVRKQMNEQTNTKQDGTDFCNNTLITSHPTKLNPNPNPNPKPIISQKNFFL